MAQQHHQSNPRILGRRTLAEHHRHLAARLRPGMAVLDIGCGTGAITVGIAERVGAGGLVVGVDRDESLLAIARREHAAVPRLRFEHRDGSNLDGLGPFDIVTASRVLQWIDRPDVVVSAAATVLEPGGRLVVLDYVHEDHRWEPDPPAAFSTFYRAFLDWRTANGWDNRMGEHLAPLAREAGFEDVEVVRADEISTRGETSFETASRLWLDVIEGLGSSIVEAGFSDRDAHAAAVRDYEEFIRTRLTRQTLSMRCLVATYPAGSAAAPGLTPRASR